MAAIIAYACSKRPNALWSAAQFNNALPKNRTDCDIPLVSKSEADAEIERLREALEPFARFFKSELHDLSPASDATIVAAFQDQATGAPLADLSIADFRRAWDTLTKETPNAKQ